MPWVTPGCLGVGLLLLSPASRPAIRLRRLGLLDSAGRSRAVAVPWLGVLLRRRRVLPAAGAVVGGLLGAVAAVAVTGRVGTVWPVSAAAALTTAVVGQVVTVEVAGRLADRDGRALGAAVACLADELRAGQRPAAALTAAAGASDRPAVVRIFAAAAAAKTLGGDVPATVRAEASRLDPDMVTAGIDMLAAAWAVSDRSGAPLADALDRADAHLRSRERQRQLVTAQLAGPRATATLLAGLPVLGLGLAAGSGGQPLAILFGTRIGQAALLAGAVLQAIGTLWSMRIIRSATARR